MRTKAQLEAEQAAAKPLSHEAQLLDTQWYAELSDADRWLVAEHIAFLRDRLRARREAGKAERRAFNAAKTAAPRAEQLFVREKLDEVETAIRAQRDTSKRLAKERDPEREAALKAELSAARAAEKELRRDAAALRRLAVIFDRSGSLQEWRRRRIQEVDVLAAFVLAAHEAGVHHFGFAYVEAVEAGFVGKDGAVDFEGLLIARPGLLPDHE